MGTLTRKGARWICAAVLLLAGCAKTVEPGQVYETALELQRRGDLKEAANVLERYLGSAGKRTDNLSQARLQLLHAEVLLGLSEIDRARELLERRFPLEGEWRVLEARRQLAAGESLLRSGGTRQAGPLLDAAGKMLLPSDDAYVRIRLLLFRGRYHLQLQQFEEAERIFGAAIAEAAAEDLPEFEAGGLLSYSTVLIGQGRFDEAVPHCERAVVVARRVSAARAEAAALGNLSLALGRMGQLEAAVEHRTAANRLFAGIGDRDNLQRGYGSLADLQWLARELDEAIQSWSQAYRLAEEIEARYHSSMWAGNLAAAYIEKANWREAERWNGIAVDWKKKTSSEHSLVYNAQNEALIAAGTGNHEGAIHSLRKILSDPSVPVSLRWFTHAGLARSLAATGDIQGADGEFRRALALIEDTRSDLEREEFKITFLSSLIRFYRVYVRFLLEQNQPERALEVADSSHSRLLMERTQSNVVERAGTAAAFRSVAAQARAVLLSYWLDPEESRLWIVRSGGIASVALPPASEIASLVDIYRRSVADGTRDPLHSGSAAGRKLYEMLIEPARAFLPAGSRVVIVPDGPLHYLNFETLPVPGDPSRYWIEDATVSITPALGILAGGPPTSRLDGRVLVIGDAASADPRYPPLRFASEEIHGIQARWRGARCRAITGGEATPAAWQAAEPGAWSLIHFAAHAEANARSPLDSAIILSPVDGRYKLYARDIASQRLRADLVTISACSSAGVKSYAGEGLVGLAWVFLRAGANSVIAGLWDVNDRSTAVLMDQLYGAVADGRPPPDALRQAKLALLRDSGVYSRPYHWAPFQVYTRVAR